MLCLQSQRPGDGGLQTIREDDRGCLLQSASVIQVKLLEAVDKVLRHVAASDVVLLATPPRSLGALRLLDLVALWGSSAEAAAQPSLDSTRLAARPSRGRGRGSHSPGTYLAPSRLALLPEAVHQVPGSTSLLSLLTSRPPRPKALEKRRF